MENNKPFSFASLGNGLGSAIDFACETVGLANHETETNLQTSDRLQTGGAGYLTTVDQAAVTPVVMGKYKPQQIKSARDLPGTKQTQGERLFLIKQFDWTVSNAQLSEIVNIDPAHLLMDKKYAAFGLLDYHTYASFGIEVIVQINPTSFQQGGLVFSLIPGFASSSSRCSFKVATHGQLNCNINNFVRLRVPYVYTRGLYNLKKPLYSVWRLVGIVYAPLNVGTGTTTTVTVSVLARFVDLQLHGINPLITALPQMKSGSVTIAPGQDAMNLANQDDSAQWSLALGDEEFKSDTSICGDVECVDFSQWYEVPGFLDAFSYNASASAGSRIVSWDVSVNTGISQVSGHHHMTPLSYVATQFAYWRGDIVYSIEAFCTKYHSGRLFILYVPGATSADDAKIDMYAASMGIAAVFDVAGVNSTFTFRVPWTNDTPYLPTGTTTNSRSSLGRILVFAYTKLNCPSNVVQSVRLVVEHSGVDMEFYCPISVNVSALTKAQIKSKEPEEQSVVSEESETTTKGALSFIKPVGCIEQPGSVKVNDGTFPEMPIGKPKHTVKHTNIKKFMARGHELWEWQFTGNNKVVVFPFMADMCHTTTNKSRLQGVWSWIFGMCHLYQGPVNVQFSFQSSADIDGVLWFIPNEINNETFDLVEHAPLVSLNIKCAMGLFRFNTAKAKNYKVQLPWYTFLNAISGYAWPEGTLQPTIGAIPDQKFGRFAIQIGHYTVADEWLRVAISASMPEEASFFVPRPVAVNSFVTDPNNITRSLLLGPRVSSGVDSNEIEFLPPKVMRSILKVSRMADYVDGEDSPSAVSQMDDEAPLQIVNAVGPRAIVSKQHFEKADLHLNLEHPPENRKMWVNNCVDEDGNEMAVYTSRCCVKGFAYAHIGTMSKMATNQFELKWQRRLATYSCPRKQPRAEAQIGEDWRTGDLMMHKVNDTQYIPGLYWGASMRRVFYITSPIYKRVQFMRSRECVFKTDANLERWTKVRDCNLLIPSSLLVRLFMHLEHKAMDYDAMVDGTHDWAEKIAFGETFPFDEDLEEDLGLYDVAAVEGMLEQLEHTKDTYGIFGTLGAMGLGPVMGTLNGLSHVVTSVTSTLDDLKGMIAKPPLWQRVTSILLKLLGCAICFHLMYVHKFDTSLVLHILSALACFWVSDKLPHIATILQGGDIAVVLSTLVKNELPEVPQAQGAWDFVKGAATLGAGLRGLTMLLDLIKKVLMEMLGKCGAVNTSSLDPKWIGSTLSKVDDLYAKEQLSDSDLTWLQHSFSIIRTWKLMLLEKTGPEAVPLTRAVDSCLMKLTTMIRQRASTVPPSTRPEPSLIYMWGKPGGGKSIMANAIAYSLAEKCGVPGDAGIYVRPPGSDFWDGYVNQPVVLIDDLGQASDDKAWQDFCQIVSTAPLRVNMADLVDKGRRFDSPYIVCTSNQEKPTPKTLYTYEAIYRRFHIKVAVEPRDDYTMTVDDQPRLDIDKAFEDDALADLSCVKAVCDGKEVDVDMIVDMAMARFERGTKYHRAVKEAFSLSRQDRFKMYARKRMCDTIVHMDCATYALLMPCIFSAMQPSASAQGLKPEAQGLFGHELKPCMCAVCRNVQFECSHEYWTIAKAANGLSVKKVLSFLIFAIGMLGAGFAAYRYFSKEKDEGGKQQGAYSSGKPTIVKAVRMDNSVNLSAQHQGAIENATLVQSALVALGTGNSETECSFRMNGLMLKGNYILAPTHFVKATMPTSEYLFFTRDGVTYTTLWTDTKVHYFAGTYYDACVIEMHGFSQFRDITNHFVREADLSSCLESNGILATKLYNTGQYITETNLRLLESFSFDMGEEKLTTGRTIEGTAMTQAGMCGGILVSNNTKAQNPFLGLHIAGRRAYDEAGDKKKHKPAKAFAAVVTHEMLQDIFNPKEPKAKGQIGRIWRVEIANKVLPGPKKSDYETTPLFGIVPVTKSPAVISPYDERTEEDFRGVMLEKYNKSVIEGDPVHFKSVVQDLSLYLESELAIGENKFLTMEEAIFGVDGLDPIDTRTSAGIPFVFEGKTKKDLWDNETQTISPYLRERVEKMQNDLLEGKQLDVTMATFPKDELRDNEKITLGKTRAIDGSPVDYCIVFRMIFGRVVAALQSKPGIKTGCAVGIDPETGWDALYRSFSPYTHVCDIDYRAFDGSLQPFLLRGAFRVLAHLAGVDEILATNLTHCMIYSKHHIARLIYHVRGSLPSGMPATSIVNSLCNLLLIKWAMRKQGYDGLAFHEMCAVIVYGDDLLLGVKPSYLHMIDLHYMEKCLEAVGMEVTNADKTKGLKWKEMRDCTFLKRQFLYQPSTCCFHAAIALDTIYGLINWKRKGASLQVNLDTALAFAFHHGETVFKDLRHRIVAACVRTGTQYQPVQWEHLMERFLLKMNTDMRPLGHFKWRDV